MISVVILTKNEELNLPGCIASVKWSDDIHVFDSYSSDRTVELCKELGAIIHQREFDDYSSQRNAALKLDFKHPWVLILDADERIPESLHMEMVDYIKNAPPEIAACRARRKDYFFGTWLKHAQISPYYIRLVKPRLVHYEREVNEVLKVDGKIHDFCNSFDHFPFSKGISHWFDKHNAYSTMEAQLIVNTGGGEFSLIRAILASDFNERRVHQKALFYRLPFRPIIKWFYMMFIRGAILDGKAGITYSFLQAIYEYMIVLKAHELRKHLKPRKLADA